MTTQPMTVNNAAKSNLVKAAQVSGVLIAVGYLFLVMLMAIRRDEFPQAGPILSIAVTALIGGIAAAVVGFMTRGVLRSCVLAGIGLLLLILTLMLSWKVTISAGLQVLYGGRNGLLAFGFALVVLVLGCLQARGQRPDSGLLRAILGALATVALMLYLVQLLVVLAQGDSSRTVYGEIFSGGDVVMIIYTALAMLGLLTILSIALAALSNTQDIAKLEKGTVVVAMGIFYLAVGLTCLRYFLAVFQGTSAAGRQVLDLVTEVVAGLVPLAGVVWLCVGAVRESLLALAAIRWAVGPIEPKPAVRSFPPAASVPASPQVITPAVTTSGSASAETVSIEEQLRKLKRLREQELITEEEYQQKRKDLLARL